jgi:uncharacterized protein
MRCPRCDKTLEAMEYEDMLIHTCDVCGGEFISGDSLGQIVRLKAESFSAELIEALESQTPIFGLAVDDIAPADCPVCEEAMQPVNYGGDSGVCVDKCPRCGGVWLDTEELEKVQILQERWMEDAPEAIRTLAFDLEQARTLAIEETSGAFKGSRFSFVNAVVNRILDAA